MRKVMILEDGIEVSEVNKDKYVCVECGSNCLKRYNLENHIADTTVNMIVNDVVRSYKLGRVLNVILISVLLITTCLSLNVEKIDKQLV